MGRLRLRQHGRQLHRDHRDRRVHDPSGAAPHHPPQHHDPLELHRPGHDRGRQHLGPRGVHGPGRVRRSARHHRHNLNVHGEGGLATAFHFFHGADNGGYNAYNVLVSNLTVTGTQQAFLIWEPTVHNVTLDGATISGAKAYAIRYETIGSTLPSNIVVRNVTSTSSGYRGFYSSLGADAAGHHLCR